MKRRMSEDSIMNMSSSPSLGEALTSYAKRNKANKVSLVNDCDKLAEKVEPGYLTKLAQDIEKANDLVFHSACGKLKLIEDQMNSLKQHALQILVETKINSILHSLACNFPKKVGQVYSVYRKPNGDYYFSMLTPSEWGFSTPHEYVGSFQLEAAMSWVPVDKFSESSAVHHWVQPNQENMITE